MASAMNPNASLGEGIEIGEDLLTPGEVAKMFRVDPKTVTRWASAGRIESIRTPGGHRRFRKSDVKALLENPTGVELAEPTPYTGRRR